MSTNPIRAIVVGTSRGGFEALLKVLAPLPVDFALPILVVRHQPSGSDNYLIEALSRECRLRVLHPREGERPEAGGVYIAPIVAPASGLGDQGAAPHP